MKTIIPGSTPITVGSSGLSTVIPGGGPVNINKSGLKYLPPGQFPRTLGPGELNGTLRDTGPV